MIENEEISFPSEDEYSNAELVNQDSFERLRSKNRHKEWRRRLFYLIVALVLIAIIGVICVVLFFGLKSVEIEGNSRYSEEEILAAYPFDSTDNLFGIDLDEAEAAIIKACPYISRVSFRRVLPSTLVITVSEDAPGYFAEIHGDWFLLSDDLRVISRHDHYEEIELMELPLLRLYLPEIDRAVVGEALSFSQISNYDYLMGFFTELRSIDFPSLGAIDASDRYHMSLYTSDGRYKIEIGTAESLDAKLRFVMKVMEEAFDEFTIASVNVSYLSQVIVLEQDRLFDYQQLGQIVNK